MANRLFIGGFPYEMSEGDLLKLFGTCGAVKSVKILLNRSTGQSRGIGFVEMSTEAEARAAVAKLNEATLGSRKIFVEEARPEERPPGGFEKKSAFVERRSGKDRRQSIHGKIPDRGAGRMDKPSFGETRREGSFERKKQWGDKPSFPGKKKWGERPAFGSHAKKTWDAKPGAGSDNRKSFGGKKQWGDKPSFPGKKKWGERPAFGSHAKKTWDAKPGAGSDNRKSFGGKKKWGGKPSHFRPGQGKPKGI